MEDTIVSFETAKLAKNKGFDEPCFNHWEIGSGDIDRGNYKEALFTSGEFLTYSQLMTPYIHKDVDCGEWSAPTQSLLQKWLRDKHKKDICIIPEYYKNGINWNWQVLWHNPNEDYDYKGGTGMYGDNGEYPTYEEALEAALKYTLKNLL